MRAEAQQREGALEGAPEILAFRGSQGEIRPVGLVKATGDGGRGSQAEAQRQRVGGRETDIEWIVGLMEAR